MSKEERVLGIPLVEHGGRSFPGDVALEPTRDRYIGFYENEYGDQVVFRREADREPTLYPGTPGGLRVRPGGRSNSSHWRSPSRPGWAAS
jgi:hypothetical protein